MRFRRRSASKNGLTHCNPTIIFAKEILLRSGFETLLKGKMKIGIIFILPLKHYNLWMGLMTDRI